MGKLILIRGPSGSGKSTLAKKLQGGNADIWICEADDYFVERSGEYLFRPERIGHAHASCQQRVRTRMLCEDEIIIVSNTFMSRWEANPYLQLAKELDYEVKIYRTAGPWDADVLVKRNVHKVPLSTIQKQISKYQPLENEEEYNG